MWLPRRNTTGTCSSGRSQRYGAAGASFAPAFSIASKKHTDAPDAISKRRQRCTRRAISLRSSRAAGPSGIAPRQPTCFSALVIAKQCSKKHKASIICRRRSGGVRSSPVKRGSGPLFFWDASSRSALRAESARANTASVIAVRGTPSSRANCQTSGAHYLVFRSGRNRMNERTARLLVDFVQHFGRDLNEIRIEFRPRPSARRCRRSRARHSRATPEASRRPRQ